MNDDFKKIISFLKDKGFVYSGSEIYGGLANTWDYGPLGAILKDNIKKLWEKHFIWNQENNFKFDSPIIINSNVWKSSGHIDKFNELSIKLINNNKFYRIDKLLKENNLENNLELPLEQIEKIIKNKVKISPYDEKTKWGNITFLKLMFETSGSKVNSEEKKLYLRPETAQGIFINFNNFINTIKNAKIPFGIGQIGKAFRNEVTPGNFIFKTKEFEQMELEYFTTKNEEDKDFNNYEKIIDNFLLACNIKKQNIKKINVSKNELAHYSKKTLDYNYKFPFGWEELLGIANRGDFDLKNHSIYSNAKLEYTDFNKSKFFPSVIETSIGLERLMLAIIIENLNFDNKNKIEALNLPFCLSPYKIAVAPLIDIFKKDAKNFYDNFKKIINFPILYLENGSIGKRYKYADSIGIYYVITFDKNFNENKTVTVRKRDDKKQKEYKVEEIFEIFKKRKLF